MKTEIKSPEQKLQDRIERAKAICKNSIIDANNQYFFETETPKNVAKKIDSMFKKEEGFKANKFYYYLPEARRLTIAKELMSKEKVAKVEIRESQYLNMSTIKLSRTYHSVKVILRSGKNRISMEVAKDLTAVPDEHQALLFVQRLFPSIKMIVGI